jgi:hypothetical protein
MSNETIFNEKHFLNANSESENLALAFVKSKNIKVYPCGRRRSTKINIDGENAENEGYYIPFDPEARLNTEANNRKSVGVNSFTQTYIKFPTEELPAEEKTNLISLSVAGYLFDISLDDSKTADDIGAAVLEALGSSDATKIYANIIIQNVPLFSDNKLKYYTEVLRNQTDTPDPSASLDLLRTSETNLEHKDIENYYFSGLSFSTAPITGKVSYTAGEDYYVANSEETDSWTSVTTYEKADKVTHKESQATDLLYQHIVSLHVLSKVSTGEKDANDKDILEWQVYQPALLPEITHGETEGSIKVPGVITADGLVLTDGGSISTNGNINASKITRNDKDVPVIDLVESGDKWQLQISFANKYPKTE